MLAVTCDFTIWVPGERGNKIRTINERNSLLRDFQ